MSLEADIVEVRARIQETQQVYREVCALLFFRYGETPTANRLYQLVRKGSMSAPAKALKDFWIEVRDKSRVDVGQPDLPSDVATAAGELAATLWRMSNAAAHEALDVFRQEARTEVDSGREQLRQADLRNEASSAALHEATVKAASDAERLADLDFRLVEQQTTNAMLREQLAAARSESDRAAASLAEARRDFSTELEKLRESLAQNEQRLAAAEKRALLEIEAERVAAARARKELAQANERIGVLDAAHRQERDTLRDGVAETRTQLAGSVSRCSELEQQLTWKSDELGKAAETTIDLRRRLESLSAKLESGRGLLASSGVASRRRTKITRSAARSARFPMMPFQRKE